MQSREEKLAAAISGASHSASTRPTARVEELDKEIEQGKLVSCAKSGLFGGVR